MKSLTRPNTLSLLCALGGAVAFCLRLWFLKTGVDGKGLLTAGHIGNTLSFLVTALTLLPAALLTLKTPDAKHIRSKASRPAAVGAVLGGVGMAFAAWQLLASAPTLLPAATGVLGMAGALCAVYAAFCRLGGKKISPWVSCVIIVFLMLLPVQLYRQWSGETQLPRYFFQLLGCICLLLWAFQRTALEAGTGSWRLYLLLRHWGIFFCIAAVAGGQPVFYLTAAAWMLTDGLSVLPETSERHEAA